MMKWLTVEEARRYLELPRVDYLKNYVASGVGKLVPET